MEIMIKDFLGIDSLSLDLKAPINIIVGENEAGKSSIRDAIQWGLTGSARGCKTHNEQASLIRDGAKAAEVTISQSSGKITRKKTPKTAAAVIGPVPKDEALVSVYCDSLAFLSFPDNARREILFQRIPGLNPEGDEIGKRLMDWLSDSNPERPVDDLEQAKVAVDDLTKMAASKGFKSAEDEAIARRRIAKALLKEARQEEPKQRVTIGGTEFILPDIQEAQVREGLANLQKNRDELLQKRGKITGDQDKLPELEKELAKLKANPAKPPEPCEIERLQAALKASRANLENLKKQVENLGTVQAPKFFPVICPAFPGIDKPCPKARDIAIQGQKAAAPSKIEKAMGYVKNEKENVDRLEKDLQEAQGKEAYPQNRQDLAAKIDMLKRQAAIAAKLGQEIVDLDTRMKTGRELLEEVRTFWREKGAFDTAAAKSARAEKEAILYDVLAKALAPEGIPSRMIAEALKPMNDLLQAAAAHLFPGRTLTLNKELAIELSGSPYVILSKSAKFRVGVSFQYALAKLAGARLLMIDEADILDPRNRNQLISFLLKIQQEFDNILVFATSDHADPSPVSEIKVWWLEDGKITPVDQQLAA